MSLTACSPRSEGGAQRKGKELQLGAAQLELGAPERAAADEGDAKATPDAPVTWDYVTLGDSLAAGVGAERGYGDRYAEPLHAAGVLRRVLRRRVACPSDEPADTSYDDKIRSVLYGMKTS